MKFSYMIPRLDFTAAGKASTDTKRRLTQIGLPIAFIKRVTIAMYEAEMNVAIHGGGGEASVEVGTDRITAIFSDQGPGIPDIDLAMQEGYSTASEEIRNMGFGAGMGLPNMKRNADELRIDTEVGKGTVVTMVFYIEKGAS
ncbi:MAG: ATP-binding protein [Rectinemataceae bacterium]